MNYSKPIFTLTFILLLFSCEKLKRKGSVVVNKTKQVTTGAKQKVSEKKAYYIDKIFPTYDYGNADTENNKKRFKEHLQVDLTPDVQNIYAYGDFLGADYKVLISFTCNQATIEKIVAIKKMQIAPSKDDAGLLFLDEFKWWDKTKIESLRPFKNGKKAEYWQYLWYDSNTKQGFYEEFSL